MDELDYKLYVLAELNYAKIHSNIPDEKLYPNDWYSIQNYKTKSEIIAGAIKENKLIKDSTRYHEFTNIIKDSH